MPTIPRVMPWRSPPVIQNGDQGPQDPSRTARSPSGSLRTTAPRRAKAVSATVSGEHTRRVTHTDRSSPAPGDVDVVNPDRHLGHHLETRRGIEEDRIDPVGEHAEEPPDTGHGLEDPVPRHRLVTRPHLDIPHLMERGDQVL